MGRFTRTHISKQFPKLASIQMPSRTFISLKNSSMETISPNSLCLLSLIFPFNSVSRWKLNWACFSSRFLLVFLTKTKFPLGYSFTKFEESFLFLSSIFCHIALASGRFAILLLLLNNNNIKKEWIRKEEKKNTYKMSRGWAVFFFFFFLRCKNSFAIWEVGVEYEIGSSLDGQLEYFSWGKQIWRFR